MDALNIQISKKKMTMNILKTILETLKINIWEPKKVNQKICIKNLDLRRKNIDKDLTTNRNIFHGTTGSGENQN